MFPEEGLALLCDGVKDAVMKARKGLRHAAPEGWLRAEPRMVPDRVIDFAGGIWRLKFKFATLFCTTST